MVCLSELVSFGIQRTANLGSRDPSGSPSTASREEATSFANAFITNSNSRSKGESSANVSLKYVVFDEYKVTICRKAGAYVPVGSQLREPQDERLGLRERLGWPPRFMIKKD